MITIANKLIEIYKSEHSHFLYVDYRFYKKYKWLIKAAVILNPRYSSCEIFRKKYKFHENFVVIGLRWNGKNVKRRTNGYAKEFVDNHPGSKCIYCEKELTHNNATSDHIIPISNKGNNCQVNIVVCCIDCNNERGNMKFETYLKTKNIKYKDIKHPFI